MNSNSYRISLNTLFFFLFFSIPFAFHAQVDKADSLKYQGRYAEALHIYDSLLEVDIKTANLRSQCVDYNNMGNVYSDIGNYKKSTEFFFKSIKLAEQLNNKQMLASIYYNIANNYFKANKLNYSIDFLKKVINLLKDEKNNESIMGSCYDMMGGIMTVQKKFDSALVCHNIAEKLFTKSQNINMRTNVYVNIANLGIAKRDFKLAKEYSLKSLSEFEEQKDYIGVAASYINLQAAKFGELKSTDANYNKSLTECVALLDSAILAIKDISSPETYLVIYQDKDSLYYFLKQFDSAYFYVNKYHTLNDSIHAIEKNKQLDELKLLYDVEKKEQENLLLKKTSENQHYLVVILIIVLISIVLVSLLIFRIVKFRSRHKANQLEQQLLRLQMNPHFLFNAINSIQNFILKKSQQEAYDYLAKFAKLIRIVLNNSQEKTLLLNQELEMISLYVEIEQLRFNNSFDFDIDIGSKINKYKISVPSMLIQPYIENAIWHGLMNLGSERKGILNVVISETNHVLKIIIQDNGVGREMAKQFRSEDLHQSVGMKLAEKRLFLINQMQEFEKAKVIVTDLYDSNKKASGTKVEIFIPINGK